MHPDDVKAFEVALQSGVSKDRIKSALAEDKAVDFPIGDATIKKHRTQLCSCYKAGGPLAKGGKK